MDNEPTKKNNIVQDIMPKKRSIRDIELPSRSQKKGFGGEIVGSPKQVSSVPKKDPFEKKVAIKKNIIEEEREEDYVEEAVDLPKKKEFSYKYEYGEEKKSSKKILYITSLVFIVVLFFGVSAFFKSSKITVTPRNEMHTLTPNTVFEAEKDKTTGLGFQIVTITKDLEQKVVSNGEEQVSKKAEGSIVIYNNYSTASQKLVATTRFQTESGLIYRLVDPVTIPGKQTKNGKTVPGSIEVKVVADEPGEKYNIGLVDFTIPGFKGGDKFTQIYAKSKTNMTGGFVGTRKVVSDDIIDATDSELQNKLKEALVKDITLQIPDNFILFDSTISYTFNPLNSSGSDGDSVILQKKAVAKAIIFDKGTLSREIVSKLLPEAKDDNIKIVNLDKLVFSTKDGEPLNLNNVKNISFTLSGDAKFVWVFDENKLKTEVLGLSKKQAKIVLSSYKSISEAWVSVSPIWSQTIPENIEKISIINTVSE